MVILLDGDGSRSSGKRDIYLLSCTNWWRIPGPQNPRGGLTGGWYEHSIDLSGFAGQAITVAFRNYSRYDNYYNTYAYLDNVRVEP